MSSETLECYGAGSGKEECWPAWVNIGVPVLISVAFLFVLLILFMVWPKRSAEEEEEESFTPEKWNPNENRFDVKESSKNNASTSKTLQTDENFV